MNFAKIAKTLEKSTFLLKFQGFFALLILAEKERFEGS
jgi:hypothetical protein